MLELCGNKCFSGGVVRVVRFDISGTFRPLRVGGRESKLSTSWEMLLHPKVGYNRGVDKACGATECLSPDPAT